MTTTAEHCIAAIGLNAYRHEQYSHDLIILSLLVRFCVSHLGGSCFVQFIAVLQLTVDGYTSHVKCTYSCTMIGPGCPEVI